MPDLDYASLERMRPARTTWLLLRWDDCPSCGDTLVAPQTLHCPCNSTDEECCDCNGLGVAQEPLVYEDSPVVCLGCGIVWRVGVDENAYLCAEPMGTADHSAVAMLEAATAEPEETP
jgi:hypothetical protein